MLYTASPWLASPSDPNPRGSQDLGYQAATKWGRKQNWWKVCMKRHTLRLLPLFYSAQATAPLLPGRIPSVILWRHCPVEDGVRHPWKSSVKVCELTGEAAWTPFSIQLAGAGREVYTLRQALGAPLRELTGWREDTQHWHVKVSGWNSCLTSWGALPAHVPGLTQTSSSFLVSPSFLHLHFYHGKM